MRFVLALVLVALVAGCTQNAPHPGGPVTTTTSTPPAAPAYQAMGFDGETWPRLDGVTLTILDHGASWSVDEARRLFENRTGATIAQVSADDAGGVLQRATLEKGNPTFDVLYGIDNVLWTKAVAAGVFEPYEPLLKTRIDPAYAFTSDGWQATPVDHGYVAVNYDPRGGLALATLDDVRAHASQFVTQDPRTSSPGLGFLLATVATYPDAWRDYWRDLFANGTLVTSGWTEAYEQRFSGGYGVDYGGAGDRAIVTSYTTSPAFEHYYGRAEENLSRVVLAPNATFHQIETMGIAKGTKNLAAAQAWIEFTLTDEFQALVAPGSAVYPVVAGVDVDEVFGGLDPAPGSFEPAGFTAEQIGRDVDAWVREWVELCEAARCA